MDAQTITQYETIHVGFLILGQVEIPCKGHYVD